MHAKAWLVDGRLALLGSVNSTTNGLTKNYELLVQMRGGSVIAELAAAFISLWEHPLTTRRSDEDLDVCIAKHEQMKEARRKPRSVQQRGQPRTSSQSSADAVAVATPRLSNVTDTRPKRPLK